jgi:hypothetical protein
MRTSSGHKLRRIGLLGLAAACMAFAVGTTTARADDDHRGWQRYGWDDRGHHKHWKKHQRVVVVERPVPYYYAPPPVVVYQPPAYVYRPAPVYVPAGDSFSFSLSLH